MVFATRFPWWWGAMGPLKQPGFLQVLLFRAAVMQLKIMGKKWRNFLPKGMRVAGKVFLFEVQIMRPFCVSKKTWKSPVENFVARKLSLSNMFLKEAVKDIGICWIVFCDGWAASKRYRQNEPSHLMRNKWYADIWYTCHPKIIPRSKRINLVPTESLEFGLTSLPRFSRQP